jgi:FtsP/CotA-like multicopper oxidase with cupredoxin domain
MCEEQYEKAVSREALMQLTRRDLLRWGIVLGGGALLPAGQRASRADDLPSSPPTTPFVVELKPGDGIPPIATPGAIFPTLADPGDCVNVDGSRAFHVHGPRTVPTDTEFFVIHETAVNHVFHPQLPPNPLWAYNGSIPGPTFVATSRSFPPAGITGQAQLVRFVNDLRQDFLGIGEPITAIHRHGGFQNPEDDGYPLDTFCFGQSRDYFYPNTADAGLLQSEHSTNWYHDHAIDITAENVYRGLAGFYLYRNKLDTLNENDTSSTALRLPSGEFDIGLVIQDRLFNSQGFLVYNSFDHNGFLGDKFLVNGKIQPFLSVAARKYRFRILNGSSARVYQLFLSNGQPFVAIGTDSHLLPAPVTVQSFRLAPAERVEVVVDFTNQFGKNIFLVNRLDQTDGRKPNGLVSPGTQLLKFVVNRTAADPSRIPTTLLPVTEGPAQLLPRVKVQRTFEFERSDGAWVINGEFFDENRINARPRIREPEIWILKSGGGWVHPVHIHLSEFFVLSRDGNTPPPLERGRKDTVLIGGDVGSEVRILIKFDDPRESPTAGTSLRYVFHCHNIEHEDMRMMGQFEVQT